MQPFNKNNMKVNFTTEHKARLEALALIFLFAGQVFKGAVGATHTMWDMIHNLTINTLQSFLSSIKKEVERLEEKNEWAMTEYQQSKLADLKKQHEFVNLLIGYKLHIQEKKENAEKARELRKQILELEENSLTPQERILRAKAELSALLDDEPAPFVPETSTSTPPVE